MPAPCHRPGDPARLYLGIAAQGRGPKLVFLRALTTLLAGAQAAFDANAASSGPGKNPADPYMTALCYFNALRELGGARRIVEDEVRDRAGTLRRRAPARRSRRIKPFAIARIKEPMEITSRVSTDDVAQGEAASRRACSAATPIRSMWRLPPT